MNEIINIRSGAEGAVMTNESTELWFVNNNGHQFTNLSEVNLVQLLKSGAITSTATIWTNGWHEWKPITETKFAEYCLISPVSSNQDNLKKSNVGDPLHTINPVSVKRRWLGNIAVFLLAAFLFAAYLNSNHKPQPQNLMSRDEFKTAVMGKTTDEVIQIMGRPDSTNENADSLRWFYEHRTLDPTTGKGDNFAHVIFEVRYGTKRVVRVSF